MPGLGDVAARRLGDPGWLGRELKRIKERINRIETSTPANAVVLVEDSASAAFSSVPSSVSTLTTLTVPFPAGYNHVFYTAIANLQIGSLSSSSWNHVQCYIGLGSPAEQTIPAAPGGGEVWHASLVATDSQSTDRTTTGGSLVLRTQFSAIDSTTSFACAELASGVVSSVLAVFTR